MKNKVNQRREIYDPISQPVSYVVVYGLVPELRESLKPYRYDLEDKLKSLIIGYKEKKNKKWKN